MAKLLLTSVCRPFGGEGEGDSVGAELFHAQVTRAQGAFSLRQVIRVWGLDYIAENLDTPTVVLHYPSEEELARELRTGNYTHVGINFVVATFHKARAVANLVRQHAPSARIILGGYGTVLPDEVLRPHGDAICREEGVGFMRRLLGEPTDRPIRHPHAPIPAVQVMKWQSPSVVGHVTAGLGCPNGCDFCCTSHFFRRKYVPLLETGRDVYEALIATRARARERGEDMRSFIIIDEDFFLQHKRARQFLDAVREGGEALSIMGFGSVRGLSRFSAREIAEMGFELVWNAFEGKGAGYEKQQGRPYPELYRDLKSVGCAQLTSMIIGFPYQDEAGIRAEFEELMALEPGLAQCLIYFAFPGTPFHEQVIAEDRYLPRLRERPDLRRWDGFSMHFGHPKIAPERIEQLQREIYQQDFERLGPSVMRLARVWLTGFENLREDPSLILRQRAERLRQNVRGALPAIATAKRFGPSEIVRDKAAALHADIVRLTGELSTKERVIEAAAPALYLYASAAERLGFLQQPGMLRVEHRLAGPATKSEHVMRLQGQRFAGLGRVLLEDLGRHARSAAGRLWPAAAGRSTANEPRVEDRVVTTRPCQLGPSLDVEVA